MVNTTSGAMGLVVGLPSPWPNSAFRLNFALEDGEIIIDSTDSGSLRLQVIDSHGHACISFVSVVIQVSYGGARVVLTARWGTGFCEVHVNDHILDPFRPGAVRLIRGEARVATRTSIHDAEATMACREWINCRKSKFAVPSKTSASTRPKTLDEQASELRGAIATIRHLRREVEAGNTHFLGPLCVALRALVFWKNDKGRDERYDPLLMRMASWEDLPLPVYFFRDAEMPPGSPVLHIRLGGPHVVDTTGAAELGDLQEFLKTSMIRLGPGESDISALGALAAVADKDGGSHFDDRTSDYIDAAKKIGIGSQSGMSKFVCKLAEAVSQLSVWVLEELALKGRISASSNSPSDGH